MKAALTHHNVMSLHKSTHYYWTLCFPSRSVSKAIYGLNVTV